MKGHVMRKLFVKGEVIDHFEFDGYHSCIVTILNDGNFVHLKAFRAKNKADLEKQFFKYLETNEFQRKLNTSRIDYCVK